MPHGRALPALGSIALALALALVLCACRDASGGGGGALTIIPSPHGSSGCSGPDQVFTAPQAPVDVTPAALVIGPMSQVTAAAGGELLYATADGASVVSIDMSQAPPVVDVLVPPGVGAGTIADLLAPDITDPASLSGIAVLDATTLIVVEQTSNTLITVSRTPPHTVDFYAGFPSTTPGRADGPAGLARFSFGTPAQVVPTGSVPPQVFVADADNHSIRVVQADPLSGDRFVTTIAGAGTPGHDDDADLDSALFDTPTGLSAACTGALIVSEIGEHAAGLGHRIRQLEIGQPSPFGGFFGTATTLAGTGVAGSVEGDEPGLPDADAQVSAPVSPLVTADGEIYWIDSGTGVLRRLRMDGIADCPLTANCGTASFTVGNVFSLTQTQSGVLYVMDATDGILYRVTP